MKKTALFLALLLSLSLFAADDEDEELLAAVDNLGPAAEGYISEGDFGPENQTFNDNRVLRDFIESRGLIECRKKCGQLTIAGDARARWLASGEKVHGDKARGMGTTTAINRFKNEFNLFLDYTTGCSWVSTKLRWDSFAGNDGGSATKVELDRAFIGYDVHQEGDRDFYIELGRSNLGLMFESRVEFGSPFSGIHLYYTDSWENVGTLTVHGGPFVMDSYLNHYAWVAEAGITELGGSGLAVKYTLIDWQRSAPTLNYGNLPASGSVQIRDNPRYRFLVYIWAGQALLWGVSFLEIARDPVAKYPLIKYSYLEKAVTSACVLSAVSRGTVPRRFGVAIMATDLVWIPAFAYVHAYLAGRIDE
ncbi:MAG: hypothetical protein K1000chlam4_00561 [Chlamydiae bacterium]|nr:hypothetical protein [Chlamydiota bacterium]